MHLYRMFKIFKSFFKNVQWILVQKFWNFKKFRKFKKFKKFIKNLITIKKNLDFKMWMKVRNCNTLTFIYRHARFKKLAIYKALTFKFLWFIIKLNRCSWRFYRMLYMLWKNVKNLRFLMIIILNAINASIICTFLNIIYYLTLNNLHTFMHHRCSLYILFQ